MSSKKHEDKQEGIKAKDASRERMYFTVTPRLVWALSEDPFDLALWIVIKDIAGDDGECILARDDLAVLAMMSSGQVSKSRDRLLDKKLIKGELRRDPGYPQGVWHLSIPDFWESNIRWARMYSTIRSRVEFKRLQKDSRRVKEPSQGDASGDSSRSDGGLPQGDGGLPQGDAKKNVLKESKEEIREEELKKLFLKVSDLVFPDVKDISKLREVKAELELARFSFCDNAFIVSGLPGDRPEYYDDRYRLLFERAFVGISGEEVSIMFTGSGDAVPS